MSLLITLPYSQNWHVAEGYVSYSSLGRKKENHMYEDGVMKVINTLMREIAVLKDKVSALEEENKELKQKLKSTQTRPWFKKYTTSL
jgi:cell division protein FtsB